MDSGAIKTRPLFSHKLLELPDEKLGNLISWPRAATNHPCALKKVSYLFFPCFPSPHYSITGLD